ncbi:MAG: hypothetical protein ACLU4N_08660 [Butyricimonas faecihominis]
MLYCGSTEQNGIPYQKVGTGLIATVGKGECIAIRADMDALKVKEETDYLLLSK